MLDKMNVHLLPRNLATPNAHYNAFAFQHRVMAYDVLSRSNKLQAKRRITAHHENIRTLKRDAEKRTQLGLQRDKYKHTNIRK